MRATLVSKIRALDPDVIFIAGDLVNSDDQNEDIAVNLIQKLVKIAPVYASMGNHEEDYDKNFNATIENDYAVAGATVLDRTYTDISINGQDMRVGGIYGYCMPEKFLQYGEANKDECAFLEDFMKTDPPDQGFWPGRESGLYLSDDGTRAMVLTRGLGSHEKIPRMNNRPEIMDIHFEPAGAE